jgi:hypothetical protein
VSRACGLLGWGGWRAWTSSEVVADGVRLRQPEGLGEVDDDGLVLQVALVPFEGPLLHCEPRQLDLLREEFVERARVGAHVRLQQHSAARRGPTWSTRLTRATLPEARSRASAAPMAATGTRSAWDRLPVERPRAPHTAFHLVSRARMAVARSVTGLSLACCYATRNGNRPRHRTRSSRRKRRRRQPSPTCSGSRGRSHRR